jgi:type IV pilus assembly protein PilZ
MSMGATEFDRIDRAQQQQPVRWGRVGIQIPVDVQGGQEGGAGITRNISRGGAFVATRRRLRIGERVTLRLAIPGYAVSISVTAVVRWIRAPGTDDGAPAGAGIQFVDPSIGASAAIVALLQADAAD